MSHTGGELLSGRVEFRKLNGLSLSKRQCQGGQAVCQTHQVERSH